jgi:hypothetical protein
LLLFTFAQVISPDRGQSPGPGRRKPYKTTINTATDNIVQNRASDNARYSDYYTLGRSRDVTEHYKVPRSQAPVESLQSQQRRRQLQRTNTDPEMASARFTPSAYRTTSGSRSQFTSTGDTFNSKFRAFGAPQSPQKLISLSG